MELNNSLKAWFDERTQEKVKSDKLKIMNRLLNKPNQSARQLAGFFDNKESIRKRCSDLFNEGLICVSGEKNENGYINSTYSINYDWNGLHRKKEKISLESIHNEYLISEFSVLGSFYEYLLEGGYKLTK